MGKKECYRCHLEKPVEDFPRERKRPDGLAVWCRACFADYARSRSGRAVQAKQRASAKRRDWLRRYYGTKDYQVIIARKREEQKLERAARAAVRYAVRTGRLRQPTRCEFPGGSHEGRLESHHYRGYTEAHWLDVIWLCCKHHRRLHVDRL